jgi:hypothetical protein
MLRVVYSHQSEARVPAFRSIYALTTSYSITGDVRAIYASANSYIVHSSTARRDRSTWDEADRRFKFASYTPPTTSSPHTSHTEWVKARRWWKGILKGRRLKLKRPRPSYPLVSPYWSGDVIAPHHFHLLTTLAF